MIYGIMMACMVNTCEPPYKKEYGPFNSSSECMKNAQKALQETPPNYRYNPRYTCTRK